VSREDSQRRRRIRLAPNAYAEVGAICSITVAVKDRTPVFADPTVADAAVDVLRRHAAETGVPVYAWCVMPDHVHLVLGASPTCDMVTFVGQFKNLAQREAWRLGVKGAFWQASFWDHFLRGDERLEQVIEYVMNNPVRWWEYRLSGSTVFEIADAGGGQAPALRRRC
jgi:REP element-mobilizing transposase RayT